VSVTRLFLSGIRCEGRHGANPGEKDALQPFVVDLDLEVRVDDDAIDATADYRAITQAARDTVAGTSFDLLESVAAAVAEAVAAMHHVVRATAVVHKPNAAASIGIEGVAAAAQRAAARHGQGNG
jgi:dihydroneopterin aldolase